MPAPICHSKWNTYLAGMNENHYVMGLFVFHSGNKVTIAGWGKFKCVTNIFGVGWGDNFLAVTLAI